MIGGNLKEMPPDYIENQRKVNALHADGSEVNESDWEYAANVVEELAEKFEPPRTALVLGCRMGHEMQVLKGEFPDCQVMGIDIVPEFVLAAQKKGLATFTWDMHDLPFREGFFDWVISIATLEHAYDVRQAAREMKRVAGRVLYTTADLENYPSNNPSHYAFTKDPHEWYGLFVRPGWNTETEVREADMSITSWRL